MNIGKVVLLGSALVAGISPAANAQGGPGMQVGEDIRGLRGPISIPEPFPYGSWAIGATLMIAVLWFGYRFWKRRSQKQLTVHERAFEALAAARAWIAANRPQEFSFAVSSALRAYIEESFGLPATLYTTEEFLAEMSLGSVAELRGNEDALRHFLNCADIVKFARGALGQEQMASMLDAAWEFVERTRSDRCEQDSEPQLAEVA